jgi:hypothetical protein
MVQVVPGSSLIGRCPGCAGGAASAARVRVPEEVSAGVQVRYEVRVNGRLSERARGAFPAMDGTSVPAQTIVFGELDESSGLGDLLALCTAMGLEVASLRRLPGQAATRPGTPAADEARRACVVTRATHHQACPNHRISEPSWGSDQDRRRGDVCGDEARREQSNAPAWRSGEPWPPADTSVMVLGDPPGPSPHRYTRAAPGSGRWRGRWRSRCQPRPPRRVAARRGRAGR